MMSGMMSAQTHTTFTTLKAENSGIYLIDSYAYVNCEGYGVIKYPADEVRDWETVYKFKRTTSFGTITYEKMGIVPQIRDVKIRKVSTTSVRLDIAYSHRIADVKCYVDGKLYKQFSPGQFEEQVPDAFLYSQYWGISGLKKGVEYTILIEVRFKDGSIDAMDDINIKI